MTKILYKYRDRAEWQSVEIQDSDLRDHVIYLLEKGYIVAFGF